MRAKAPLADLGWCSAQRIRMLMIASGNHTIICAAPVRTLGLRGSELPSFCVPSLTQFDNPSVKNQRFLPAPFTQGSRGCSRTSAFPQSVHFLLRFDNPSVKNQRFLPAVHCGMTATGSHGNFDSLRGAPPFAQGSRWALPHQCVFQWYSEELGDCRASNEAVPTHRIFRLYFWKIYATITRFLLFGGNYENPAAHLLRALRQPTH